MIMSPLRLFATFGTLGIVLSLAACQKENPETVDSATPVVEAAMPTSALAQPAGDLAAVLAAQPEKVQARYAYRHPQQTLEFFGIEPGMKVVEALPGGGWYSKILAPYLGEGGQLVGVDYDKNLFPLFGFFSAERLAAKETWAEDWVIEAKAWFDSPVADIQAFQFGSMPSQFEGQLDAVLMIRALHNLARFEQEGGFLTTALEEVFRSLKPGGVVGVVQHMADESAPDDWATGDAGYLKKSFVIEQMEAAGLELVAESDINTNAADQPSPEDIVWRLPPTLMTSGDDAELAARYTAIGESNRMTLLFRKPA